MVWSDLWSRREFYISPCKLICPLYVHLQTQSFSDNSRVIPIISPCLCHAWSERSTSLMTTESPIECHILSLRPPVRDLRNSDVDHEKQMYRLLYCSIPSRLEPKPHCRMQSHPVSCCSPSTTRRWNSTRKWQAAVLFKRITQLQRKHQLYCHTVTVQTQTIVRHSSHFITLEEL